MPRIRTIKPEFWRNGALAGTPEFTRLMAIAVLNLADDEGYFEADPRLVRGDVFPFEEDSQRIHGALTELSNIGYITLTETPNKGVLGVVVNFSKHQCINRPTKSKLRVFFQESNNKPNDSVDSVISHPLLTEDSLSTHGNNSAGTGNREQGKGTGNREREGENPLSLSSHFFSKDFCESWKHWKNKQQSKTGRTMDPSTEMCQLKELERFTLIEAIEIIEFSTSRTDCKNLITNGDHNRKDKPKDTEELVKNQLAAIKKGKA